MKQARNTATQRNGDKSSRANRGLTCANCRLRKTRCDGTQPGCKTCEVYHDVCRYEKPPPMTQIVAMARRLQEVEQANVQLQKQLEQVPGYLRQGKSQTGSPSTTTEEVVDSSDVPADPPSLTQATADESTVEEKLLSELSLDENGNLCYYGPTSAVHAPPSMDSRPADGHSSASDLRSLLAFNALESRSWEEFALGNAAVQTDIPRAMLSRLLQIYWTWTAPTFLWVYRPAFIRDMTVGGPCYSPFLLTVMCGHAARFDQNKTSDVLISRARLLLGAEIQRPSSIPTAQALLQLSARELAWGSISQAWLYSGMAFRMVSDLGLHYSTGKIMMLGQLSAEDLEIRRRLFWSCYFWDKAISLYLGRMPALRELPVDRAPKLFDDSAEEELWSPHYGDTVNLSRVSVGEYPPTKSHVISCFENSCRLAVILNDIILHLYSRRANNTGPAETLIRGIRDRLAEWRETSPNYLKYDPDNLPDTCPPPHIITQNLFYYTTIILLNRPFYSTAGYHATCRKAADSIEKLLLLLEKTFGLTRITYLMAYCIYTGASVMMQDTKAGDFEAGIRMQTFLRALRHAINTCPVVQRSLDIITNGLKSENAKPTETATADDPGGNSLVARNYLPAFPYRASLETGHGEDTNVGSMDLDSFSLLDCYPENHFDGLNGLNDDGVGGWFLPP